MKKLIPFIAFTIVSLTIVSAQDYNWAVGVRLGGETGGTSVKYKLDNVNALETIFASSWTRGLTFTALYERHIPVIDRGFHFYYGAGGHVGSLSKKFSLGVDGIAGLEYKLRDVPLVFSLDYKPNFNIVRKTKFYLADIALGIRVAF